MSTDWNLIRKLLNAAIDACEETDRLKIDADEKSLTTKVGSQDVSVWDFLQSAWIYPENLRDSIIRLRNKIGEDRKFTNEIQRTLQNVSILASELSGLENLDKKSKGIDPYSPEKEQSARDMIEALIDFYKNHYTQGISTAINKGRKAV